MSNYLNADGIVYDFRTGLTGDEFQSYVLVPHVVYNNYIILDEFPVRLNRVQIYEGTTPYTEIDGESAPTALQYYVSYQTKRILFNSAAEGKTLLVSYKGRGMAFISTDMVYSKSSGGSVTETLSDIIIAGETAIGNLAQVNTAITNANNATTAANNAAASLSHKGTYDNSISYIQNNEVFYGGSTYTCILSSLGNLPTNNTYWSLSASQGIQGIQGDQGIQGNQGIQGLKGNQWQHAYNNATTYAVDSVVGYNGTSYICILASTGNVPTDSTYWDIFAQAGANGSGSVASITSSNGDLVITGTTADPILTVNSATSGANKILKLDVNGLTTADILIDGTTNKAYTAAEKTKLANTQKVIAEQTSAPLSPVTDDLWIDTTSSPNVLKRYNGSVWVIVGSTSGGTVTNVTSPNSDISIANGTTTPSLTLNSSVSATPNSIVKRDVNGFIAGNILGNAATVTTNANLTGDVTSVGNATTLASVGTAGTYTKVTTDSKGRIISGVALLVASDIPNLDWAKITTGKPTTISGYGIIDGQKIIIEQSATPTSPVTDDLWVDTTSTPNILKRYDGSTWLTIGSSSGGTVTSVTSANSDISISTNTTTPVLTLNASATVVNDGIVKRDGSGFIAGNILGNAATVTTNANLTGDVTSSGNATTIVSGVITKAKTANNSLQRAATITVAASNSTAAGLATADFVCTGVNDEATINNAINSLPLITYGSGTLVSATSLACVVPVTYSSSNVYVGYSISITSGVGIGQKRIITSTGNSSGNTNLIISPAWTTTPNSSSTYVIQSQYGKVVLLEGLFIVSNSILVNTNIELEGQGTSTLIKVINGNSLSFPIISTLNATDYFSSIFIKSLKIDGNKANSVSSPTQSGISFTKLRFGGIIENLHITNCNTYGIILTSSLRNNINKNYISYNNQHGIYLSGSADNCISSNILNTNLQAGIQIGASSTNNVISGNQLSGNSTFGISTLNSGDENSITGNAMWTNGVGIDIASSFNVINGNMISFSINNGINISSNYNSISGNIVKKSQLHGISLSGASYNNISGNFVTESSFGTTLTSSNIILDASSSNNIVQGNNCYIGANASVPIYGIRVNASTCSANLITTNNLTNGGSTSAYSDLGTGTVVTAGNKLS